MQATLTGECAGMPSPGIPAHDEPATIQGGFIKLGVLELTLAWAAFTEGQITALDFRVWLAAFEVAKRRTWLKRGQQPRFTAKELHALVGGGGGERGVRRSTRRLRCLGLLTWTEKGPKFATKARELTVDLTDQVEAMRELMPYRRRFVPLPRRMLRLLAGGVKRSVMATVLGHASRCIYRKDKQAGWSGDGACSASWIAETFSVGESSARKARAHLRDELGWLTSLHDRSQWFVNTNGGRFEVDLSWQRPEARAAAASPVSPCAAQPAHAAKSLEAPEFSTGKMRGPLPENERVLRGLEEQTSSPKEKNQPSDPWAAPPEPPSDSCLKKVGEADRPARLHDIKPEDLRSTSRVMELFDQALTDCLWAKAGVTPIDSWPERLNWAAAAARVRARGASNPAGLFMHLVRKGKWGDVSNFDEQAVLQKMAEWRDGVPEGTYRHKRRRPEPDEEVLSYEQEEYLREQMLSSFKGW